MADYIIFLSTGAISGGMGGNRHVCKIKLWNITPLRPRLPLNCSRFPVVFLDVEEAYTNYILIVERICFYSSPPL